MPASTGPSHAEQHYVNRTGWLRAAVLGANDGLLSTASLLVGVAAAAASAEQLLLTAVAGIAAGAMSMAAGEYVSVSSQADSEAADLERERRALERHPHRERQELAQIYQGRGLPAGLAHAVATRLTEQDALEAHARDELGITENGAARPVQAALASALSFTAGGLPPLAAVLLAPGTLALPVLVGLTVLSLAVLGAIGARTGGAPVLPGLVRTTLWGTLAMATTYGIGHLFHVSIA
ncbi:MAG: VIT family protein [Sphingomonadales bacterium]|nr:VIT family protein [Sphingomonadales bacterium]